MGNYQIVLADDHEIFRLGLRTLINGVPDFEVVGEAGNGKDLLELLGSRSVDLVILDLSMPGMDGFSILEKLSAQYPGVKRLVLSMHMDKKSIKQAMVKQIDGYLNKEDMADSVLEAIDSVRHGKKYFSRDVLDLILSNYDEMFRLQTCLNELTSREKEVGRLITSGLINKQIAEQLSISIHTVQFHRSNLMGKLKLKNTADLVNFFLMADVS